MEEDQTHTSPALHPSPIATDPDRLSRRRYSFADLENLRYSDLEGQARLWKAVMKGLDPEVIREYEEISIENQKKTRNNKNKKKSGEGDRREKSLGKNQNVASGAEECTADSLELVSVKSYGDEQNPTVCEEPFEEDDDSDEECYSIQRVAFLVEGEPDFDSGPPQDGLEYLRRVRWEAERIAKVKVAKLDKSKCREQTPYMPNIPEVPKCPENIMPLKQWEDAFLADFSELRQVFSQHTSSEDDSPTVLLDKRMDSRTTKKSCPQPQMPKDQPPTVSIIRTMDAISRASLLRKLIKEFENATMLSRDKCCWIFALCVAVDSPLDAEMSAAMRCLLRKCLSLLTEKSDHDEEVAMLNVLAVISGEYFRQAER